MLTATLAADTSRIYRVTLAGASAADARDIVHLYGGRIVAVASQGGELTLRISADGAKSLSRDPRVVRLTATDSIANGSIAVDDVPDIVLGPYLYDGAGDIRTIGSEQFLYDRNTRLVSAATVPGTQTFNYDAFGNRTTATTAGIVKCNDGADCALNPDVNRNTNHLSGPQTVYDNAGNLAQIDGHAYTYDPLGMMTSQNATQFSQYVYTADDERIAVYKGTRWEWSVRDASARVLRAFTSDDTATAPASTGWTWITDNVFRGSLLLAAEHPESGRRHFHVDHLGTPRLITYDGGSIAGSYEYYAFGTQPDAGNREIPIEELKFTGHQRDLAGGDVHVLDYMHARYYDGAVGRFVSIDPVLMIENAVPNPQQWNRYAYVFGNPLLLTDPTGEIVDFGGLSEEERLRLLNALNEFTGNTYDVDKNNHLVLVAVGNDSSATATSFLNQAIGSSDTYGVASVSGGNKWNPQTKSADLNFHIFDDADYGGVDPRTFNLGSSLVHELIHGVTGKRDEVNGAVEIDSMNWTGDTVDFENKMRAERHLPIRASYLTIPVGNDKEKVHFSHVDPRHPDKPYYVTRKKF